jgi:hypothetical protein
MSKPKINNYFTNPCRMGLPIATESSFEEVVKTLCLSPEQYSGSAELRAWVERNKDMKYVPQDLLAAFGLTVQV